MSHPLLANLSSLTQEELYGKMSDLNKKLSQASRLGYGDAVHQLQIMLSDFKFEVDRRSQVALEETMSKSPDFSSIIDIS